MSTITVLSPGGAVMTFSLPLPDAIAKQVASGVLKPVDTAPVPPAAPVGGEGGAERVSAPPPATDSDPEPVPGQPVADAESLPQPAGNASREEWAAFAVAQGMHPDDAANLKREEIKARVAPADTEPEG